MALRLLFACLVLVAVGAKPLDTNSQLDTARHRTDLISKGDRPWVATTTAASAAVLAAARATTTVIPSTTVSSATEQEQLAQLTSLSATEPSFFNISSYPAHKRERLQNDDLPAAKSGPFVSPVSEVAVDTTSATPSPVVEGHIFWSEALEAKLPRGFTADDDQRWVEKVNGSSAKELSTGCGRMQNRKVTMDDGSLACARHRQNDDQIQGDILSFVLARALGLTNLPPAVLVTTAHPSLWSRVQQQVQEASWKANKAMVLTQFVADLGTAYIPEGLRGDVKRLHPVVSELEALGTGKLVELAQWSDLVVFDYLTANLDRVVNNMFNEQWNADMMSSPAHNLMSTDSGQLLFLDNESGLLHGYRLLPKYEAYHKSLLDALCIFRRSTVASVQELLRTKDLGQVLQQRLMAKHSVAGAAVSPLPARNVKKLRQRLMAVARQVNKCKSLYYS